MDETAFFVTWTAGQRLTRRSRAKQTSKHVNIPRNTADGGVLLADG